MNALAVTSLLGVLAVLPALPSSQVLNQTAPILARGPSNILGNGGGDVWSRGNSFQGPIGPDLWFAMGDPSTAFTQNQIAFTLVSGCPPAGSGSRAMQIRANLPQNYVSQQVENFSEYAGKDVTFSIRARPLFPLANARIEIDDGVSTSSETIQVQPNAWGLVTVRHTVAACPTRLEFKIFPEQTIDVDEAMATVGRLARADFIPRPNPEPALQEVPVGTVLDWYRFDPLVPVPAGFAICDGSAVTDPASPFVGRSTPNLSDKFVRGVSSVGDIGETGGSSSHNHGGQTGENEGGNGAPPGDFWWMSANQFTNLQVARDGHEHDISSATHLPPYVGLLKIVRVK